MFHVCGYSIVPFTVESTQNTDPTVLVPGTVTYLLRPVLVALVVECYLQPPTLHFTRTLYLYLRREGLHTKTSGHSIFYSIADYRRWMSRTLFTFLTLWHGIATNRDPVLVFGSPESYSNAFFKVLRYNRPNSNMSEPQLPIFVPDEPRTEAPDDVVSSLEG